MATDQPKVDSPSAVRNIPVGLIADARKHVYEAAIRTPLVRLNCDGPADIYLKLECLQPIGCFSSLICSRRSLVITPGSAHFLTPQG